MADAKISALTGATTPLAGTEVVPVVQSSSTKKVSIANLTAGRTVAMRNADLTGGAAVINIGATADDSYHYVRTIDTDGQAIYFGNDNAAGSFFGAGAYGRVLYSEGAKPLKVFVNGAYRAEYDTSGNYKLDTGNLVIGTAGKGIDFSATAGTGTSELLADYEEGTWTPIDSSGDGLTFVAATGSYTKVGNLVSASGFVQYPVTASATGATIGGLPFTSANTANRGVGALNYKQTALAATLLLNNNATTMLIVSETGSVTANSALSNNVLYFGVTYSIP